MGELQDGIETCHGDAAQCRSALLDLAFRGDGVALLLVAVVPRSGDPMHFLLGQFSWGDTTVESEWCSTGFHPSNDPEARSA